jgi:hypothetical protein
MKLSKVHQKCKLCGILVLKSKIKHIDGFPVCKSCFKERKHKNYLQRENITPRHRNTWLDDLVLRLQKEGKSISKQIKEKENED